MEKLKKTVHLPIIEGAASERLAARVAELEGKYGQINKNLNAWLTAGFMLNELGGAVLQTWVALDESGELEGMDNTEKAQMLIELLERIDRTIKRPVKVVKEEKTTAPPPEPEQPATLQQICTDYGA